VSAVVACGDPRTTLRTIQNLLAASAGSDLEVVVVDPASPAYVTLGLYVAFLRHPQVDVVRLPAGATTSDALNAGIARATGEIVLVLAPHVIVRPGCLRAVAATLEKPEVAGVQPVVLDSQDRIVTAGLKVAGSGEAPTPVLAGHLADDARRLDGEPLDAIAPEAMALRVADVAAVAGFAPAASVDLAAADLCARLLEVRSGGFRVAPTARVTSLAKQDRRAPLTGHSSGRRRWGIRLPSPPGARGDMWGDTHFGEALAGSLRSLGEEVVVVRRGADEGMQAGDEVSLALRGLYPVPPVPGRVNVLWVISHPDEVTLSELVGYDHVFAASRPWSEELAKRADRPVVPLLQASHFEVPVTSPHPDAAELSVVFVGSADDGRRRPMVRMALDAGLPLTVYGRGWRDLPDGVWRGEYVENERLPEVYRRHGIVLADHWPDMARHGFVANRVFDAVASGARVLCDDVAGLHEVFDPRDVTVARNRDEMRRAFDELRRSERRDDVPRPSLSFRDRARTLLAEISR
jgi:GT2 family glycosyltransferase